MKALPVFSGILWLISLYFLYHALYGQRGYIALLQKREEVQTIHQKDHNLEQQCQALHTKVSLLEDQIDEDLLEQEMWKKLCLLRKDKKVLLLRTSGLE